MVGNFVCINQYPHSRENDFFSFEMDKKSFISLPHGKKKDKSLVKFVNCWPQWQEFRINFFFCLLFLIRDSNKGFLEVLVKT